MTPRVPRLLFLALAAAGTLTPEALAAAPRYKMVLDAATPEHGVQTVSLVQNPAIQRGWVALSAADATAPKRFHLSEATDGPQKQVLTGPVLLPGQEILRLDAQGNPFYITFDAPTIEAAMYRFAEQGLHGSTNQDHAIALSGNTVVESWIVRDPARDASAVLGIAEVPAGTWMMSVRIPDEAYWLSEIMTGNKTGFSIEGLFDTQQLTLSAVAPASIPVKKNWVSTLFAALAGLGSKEASAVTVALGMEQLADGRAVMIDDVTGAVTLCTMDGTPGAALPDGTYPLQNGGELIVQQGKRADNGGQGAPASNVVDAAAAPAAAGAAATPAEPPVTVAPLADTAGLPDVVKAINGILDFIKKDSAEDKQEDVASHPAAPKMAAALHGIKLSALGEKLTELKLDAIELTEGDKLTYNPVSRRLSDASGALVESGYYAAADGSYFQVSTDQYIWSIDKQTYDAVYSAKLQAVELAEVKAKLAKEPAGKVIKLHGDGAASGSTAELAPHLVFLQSVRQARAN